MNVRQIAKDKTFLDNYSRPLLSQVAPDEPIFEEESQFEKVMRKLEALKRHAEDNTFRGGIMHRFHTDKAIAFYCSVNFLDEPKVDAFGMVSAWSDYEHKRISIGWIA